MPRVLLSPVQGYKGIGISKYFYNGKTRYKVPSLSKRKNFNSLSEAKKYIDSFEHKSYKKDRRRI
jgi:hypothetical protein